MADSTVRIPQQERADQIIIPTILLLKFGSYLSFALIGIGLVLSAFQNHELQTALRSLGPLVNDLVHGRAAGFIGLGILTMIGTPVLMTLLIALRFWQIDERGYAYLTLGVTVVLIASMFVAMIG